MEDIHFNSVQEFNDYYGFETLHPLVSVVHYDKQVPITESMVHYGLYAIYLKENKGCKMSYGRTEYDFDDMTITSFEPGQVLHVEQALYGEINHSVVKQFLGLLDEYICDKAETKGLPTVAYFADKCCLSTGYFSTLVKSETGRTAKDHINERILLKAKELLQMESTSVSQISQLLGFEYPQHFIRFFKGMTGKTPAQWRAA